jgi:hypothetical protein
MAFAVAQGDPVGKSVSDDILLEENNQEVDEEWEVLPLARAAAEADLITPQTMKAIEGLDVLRNLAVHGKPEDVSPQRAHEFVALRQGVLYSIVNKV